jgi:thermitase
MRTSIKVFVLLTLSITILLAGWQAVQASAMVFGRGDVYHNIAGSQVKARIQVTDTTEIREVENTALPVDGSAETPRPDIQSNNQYIQNEPDLKQIWALEQIQALPPLRYNGGNSPVLVAILDTGIDSAHDDLSGRVIAETNFTESTTTDDIYGHGTHIAGIIGAVNDNNLGIIGLAPECRLLNVKVADDKGRCQTSSLADGIIWAVDNGANVINISIELGETTPGLKEAVNYAWENGAVIIAAAGNDGSETPVYPACCENCIGVTAIQENGTLAPLANHGDWVDVAAPGFYIYSTLPDNSYGYKHGTSFATAYVSGLAALLFSEATDTSGGGKLNDEVRQAIYSGSRDIGVDGTGRGMISVINSLTEVTAYPEHQL